MILKCNWQGCDRQLIWGGRGRRPKWCPEHGAIRKREKDDMRRGTVRVDVVLGPLRPCCRDAILAGVIGYGPDGAYHIRKAKHKLRRCPQCKSVYRYGNEQRKQDLVINRSDTRTAAPAKIGRLAEDLGNVGDGGRAYGVRDGNSTWEPWKQGWSPKERKLARQADKLLQPFPELPTPELEPWHDWPEDTGKQLDWVAYIMASYGVVRERYQNPKTLAA